MINVTVIPLIWQARLESLKGYILLPADGLSTPVLECLQEMLLKCLVTMLRVKT